MTENEAIEELQRIRPYVEIVPQRAEALDVAIKALEEIQRWHTSEVNPNIKNVFANMSTQICHNCDHKDEYIEELEAEIEQYRAIGTVEECRTAMEKQNSTNKELESHDEKHTLECCISLMQELVNEFAEWYRWQHGEDAIEGLDEEERFCFRKSYFCVVQELFLLGTNHSGGTSTRAKCEQLGVDSAEEIEFDWSDEE